MQKVMRDNAIMRIDEHDDFFSLNTSFNFAVLFEMEAEDSLRHAKVNRL